MKPSAYILERGSIISLPACSGRYEESIDFFQAGSHQILLTLQQPDRFRSLLKMTHPAGSQTLSLKLQRQSDS